MNRAFRWFGATLVAASGLTPVQFDQKTIENRMRYTCTVNHIPGIVAIVAVPNQFYSILTEGLSDVENLTAMTQHSVVRLGSISKLITALMTMKLHENGAIDIDKPLTELFKEHGLSFKHEGEEQEITIKHLLSHTSGIRHYRGDEFYSSEHYPTIRDALKVFEGDELEHKPGEKFLYTTYGYTLLSWVLEQLMSMSFEKILAEFTASEEMGGASCGIRLDKAAEPVEGRARLYQTSPEGRLRNVPYVDCSNKWAGGGMIGSAMDVLQLGRLLAAMFDETEVSMLKADTIGRMLESVSLNDRMDYGMGVALVKKLTLAADSGETGEEGGEGTDNSTSRQYRYLSIGHTGSAVGATTTLQVYYRPEEMPVIVVIVCNHESGGEVIKLAPFLAAQWPQTQDGGSGMLNGGSIIELCREGESGEEEEEEMTLWRA